MARSRSRGTAMRGNVLISVVIVAFVAFAIASLFGQQLTNAGVGIAPLTAAVFAGLGAIIAKVT